MSMRWFVPLLTSLVFVSQSVPLSLAASQPDVNFKIYSPGSASPPVGNEPSGASADAAEAPAPDTAGGGLQAETPAVDPGVDVAIPTSDAPAADAPAALQADAPAASADTSAAAESKPDGEKVASKVLQGYIRVVPSGTKIPIIMDTSVDTDTSQEGDEFSARTGEDLTIDGSTVVPAGSIIKGRIAQMNGPRHLNRSGSVALKFDSVTTPDNRQLPIVANIVARGGVVHARRGAKDILIDSSCVALPTAAGLGIGLLAGSAGNASIGSAGAGLIGVGVGAAVGVAILLSKKGKKIDIKPGDELKIELAEDLRMPM